MQAGNKNVITGTNKVSISGFSFPGKTILVHTATYSRHKQIGFSILMTFSKNTASPKLCGLQRLYVCDVVNIFNGKTKRISFKGTEVHFGREQKTCLSAMT